MKEHHEDTAHPRLSWFQLFKYTIYGLLTINIFLFFQEDFDATQATFGGDYSLKNIIEGFAATIDTAAWVVLLLLFELETYVLPDERIRGFLKWSLHGIRAFCYVFIVYAAYGYISKMLTMYDFVPYTIEDVCTLADTTFTYILLFDEYRPITMENCGALAGAELYRLQGQDLIGTVDALQAAQRLSWVDVINSIAWIFVVLILEIDVLLQLKNTFTGWRLAASKIVKVVLYSTLFAAAVYWWVYSDFLDFWDAFLWLVAFIFIEMNLLQWQAETAEQAATS